ncbi:MAG: heat-inducible transcription repressor HrcA [Deltaproteobacteria bacterium]|nr:heat-inducible transcription repressor HrcA [Deltaproteobacteria bacterium]MBW2393650.1 heat-inducible transcription repressor HrcA [Deltaproteobacteria bacterium]
MRSPRGPLLSGRQGQVMNVVVSSYVGEAAPVASDTISALLPVSLSSASVRTTLAELGELSLVIKPHRSAGSMPTLDGFRVYVDQLLEPRGLGPYEERDVAGQLESEAAPGLATGISRLLSHRTRQMGFVLAPRVERAVMRHVSFIRVSAERVLCVLVSTDGAAYQRIFDQAGRRDQAHLDHLAATLNERIVGQTLPSLRRRLLEEADDLRGESDLLLERALRLGRAASGSEEEGEILVATWLALLEQPEFHDVERVRALHAALEENERLVEVIDHVLRDDGVTIAFGDDTGEPALKGCVVVAAPYGTGEHRSTLGVIGPSRLDYARVVPLVDCVSRLATDWVGAQ